MKLYTDFEQFFVVVATEESKQKAFSCSAQSVSQARGRVLQRELLAIRMITVKKGTSLGVYQTLTDDGFGYLGVTHPQV